MTCFPYARIKNRDPFFFLDGTDFNLNIDLQDCNRNLIIKWITTLKDFILKQNRKSLILDSSKINIPKNHTFEVLLYNENMTEILNRDNLEIEFMTV